MTATDGRAEDETAVKSAVRGGSQAGSYKIIRADPAELRPWIPWMVVGPSLGVVAILAYTIGVGKATVFAVSILIAGGAMTVGALVGFLFGIPRVLTGTHEPSATAASDSGFRSNTNLEQISDWLTKILVGVGLVQIGQLSRESARLVAFLAPGLGNESSSKAFAAGLLVFFTAGGFFVGYLTTRVFLGPAFAQSEYVLRQAADLSGDAKSEQETPDKDTSGRTVH